MMLTFMSIFSSYFLPVPSGYPNLTRYPVFLSIPDPTRFDFRNHRVAGNPKHRVLPDISGKPEVSGTTRYLGYHLYEENNTIIRCSSLGPSKRTPGCKKMQNLPFNIKYDCGTPLGWTITVQSTKHINKHQRCP